jgi:solute:Na+ symporter, SSS family
MDFVRHFLPGRSETFFLRFSKVSTILWAAVLILTAYLSRQVAFVLNAAFALRGLTSGALVGGLALSVFWKKGRSIPVITGMVVSLATMTTIQLLPKLECTKALWMKVVGTEIFWPWYTFIGATITLLTASLVRTLLPPALPFSETATPASAPPATG